MAEIVNLRMARKARDRQESAAKAAQNRAAHGRTLAEKRGTAAERDRIAANVDGARRSPDET